MNEDPKRAVTDRDAAILKHYPWVRRISARLATRVPAGVEVDDIVSIGLVALIEAVDRFDPSRGVSFEGYARVRVFAAVCQALEERIPVEEQEGDAVAPGPGAPADEEWLLQQREEALREAMSGLSVRERIVLDGQYFRGRSLREIGHHLGIAEVRVASLRTHSLRRLRALMERSEALED